MRPAVLIPKGKIAMGKLAQAVIHDSTILQVNGNFDDCLTLARELSENYPVALVNSVNPFRIEGQKTASFEVVDMLGDAPDIHALPVGNAGNITAYWKGYKEYNKDGLSCTASKLQALHQLLRERLLRTQKQLQQRFVLVILLHGSKQSMHVILQAE
jgi:threonine synthase